jgi:membrane-associated phospholipid phosphatase
VTGTLSDPTPVERPDAATTASAASPQARQSWWRVPPFDRRGLIILIIGYALMTAVAIAVGLLIVHELHDVRSLDDRVARWLNRHRTDGWDSVTWCGSMIADTYVKIPATIILSLIFLWRWHRWTEPALLVGALLLEVAVFVTSSVVVDRARPPISQLDPVPPTGAFPSGHAAAAVAFYGAIAIIVFWHTRRPLARTVALLAAVLVPLAVGASRMYRGMHNLSDVVVGLLIGIVSLWLTWLVVRRGPAMRQLPPAPTLTYDPPHVEHQVASRRLLRPSREPGTRG